MPLAGVKAASEDYKAKKAAAEQGGVPFFNLADGEEASVRFLEEGDNFATYYVHRLPQSGDGVKLVPCLDPSARPSGSTACPGCEDGHKRSFRFLINLIHRDAPVPKRDPNNNNRVVKDNNNRIVFTDEKADQLKVWEGGIQVAEDLDHLDGKFGGLTSRDFEIQRSGTKLNTKYRILPAGDRSPLTPADEKLAKGKFDLNQLKKPPEYEGFYSYQRGGGGGGGGGQQRPEPTAQAQSVRTSPFARRDRTNGG